jgi:hypothetical protein
VDDVQYFDTEGTTYAAGASSSTSKTFRIPCGGQEVVLAVTNGANGGTFYCKPVIGE